MKGAALEICDKDEMISHRMSYNWMKILGILDAFWFQTFFLDITVFKITHLWHPQKMANKWPSHFYHPQKLVIDLLLKIMESANTWQILRTPFTNRLLCRHHKCMFPFWFFKLWSITCLNANEILNFMEIQSSYLLPSYQRNQASLYLQLYQLLLGQLFGKFMSVTTIYVRYSWQNIVFEM